jgi:hypothetical protein
MSLNIKMEEILKAKTKLERKLSEGTITKNEHSLLKEIKSSLVEAPIDYEGPERMEPGIERKITSKQTPFNQNPALPQDGDKDYIEVISSKRFKDSVDKVRRYLGDTTAIQGNNPMMGLMSTVMNGLQRIVQVESQNKEYLERLAVNLVVKELGIPEGSLQFDAQLVHGPMAAAQGMQTEPQQPSDEEVKDAFKKAEDHSEELEDFADEFEKFNLEKSKRRLINSLIQGAAFKGGHMYVLVSDELSRLDPNLLNHYGVTQALMEHLYWLYPDMEGMAGSGGGQMGQSEVDDETDPPTVKARAMTFPLLVHELVKGVYEVFGTHGLPDDPKQAEMVLGAEDTLPAEIWDSRLGPIFWEKFLEAYPDKLFDDDMKHIQHYLFVRFSKLSAQEFLRVAKLILEGNPQGAQFIQRMVDEIVNDLKKDEYDEKMGDDNDDDDYGDDDLDDFDLSALGF